MNKTLFIALTALLLFPNLVFGQKAKPLQKLLKSYQKKASCSAEQIQLANARVQQAVQRGATQKARQKALKTGCVHEDLGNFLQDRFIEDNGFVFPFGLVGWREAILDFGKDNFKKVFARKLEEMYPSGRFTVMMVKNVEEAQQLLTGIWHKNGQKASPALKTFLEGKDWYGRDSFTVNGYIVAVAEGKCRPIKDILFLDLKNKKWWSVRESQAFYQANKRAQALQRMEQVYPEKLDLLHTYGFLLSGERQAVSYDGIHWVPVSGPMKKQFKEWMKNKNFVLFTHKGLAVKRVFENRAAYEAWKKEHRKKK